MQSFSFCVRRAYGRPASSAILPSVARWQFSLPKLLPSQPQSQRQYRTQTTAPLFLSPARQWQRNDVWKKVVAEVTASLKYSTGRAIANDKSWSDSDEAKINFMPKSDTLLLSRAPTYTGPSTQKSEDRNSAGPNTMVKKVRRGQRLILEHKHHGGTQKLRLISHERHGKSASRLSLRALKRFRTSPAECLRLYLTKPNKNSRSEAWNTLISHGDIIGHALPTLLLQYMHTIENPQADRLDDEALAFLHQSGYSVDDLHSWAFVLSASSSSVLVDRYLVAKSVSKLPNFILLQVLARPQTDPEPTKKMVMHCWNHLLHENTSNGSETSAVDVALSNRPTDYDNLNNPIVSFEINAFEVIISRLLQRVRETWGPGLLSISYLLTTYMRVYSTRVNSSGDEAKILAMHRRMSKLFNDMLFSLSLPVAVSPYKAMRHNWEAQKVLLQFSNEFSRPLDLSRQSYGAIAAVLAASKKSPSENTYAELMQKSWPPWRREKDGMDTLRPRDADLSRVARTIARMCEAGYGRQGSDIAISSLGGRESDGTPTVPTRSLWTKKSQSTIEDKGLWAARIRATRHPVEAWAAFQSMPQGTKPTLGIYLAMFEKLDADKKSLYQGYGDALPGDAREILKIADDNFSASERQRRQPPTLRALYDTMIQQKIKPSGRCLSFLLASASNFEVGAKYLRDSLLDQQAVSMLLGSRTPGKELQRIPREIIASFVKLTCRLAIPIPADNEEAHEQETLVLGNRTYLKRIKRTRSTMFFSVVSDPISHALRILQERKSSYRPAWYALFAALAQPSTIVNQTLMGNPLNDILAWQILEAALRDAEVAGMSLDSKGFQIICYALKKALAASKEVGKHEEDLLRSSVKVKKIWEKFTSAVVNKEEQQMYFLPAMLHNIESAHIHAYVLLLGELQDINEICDVLSWMLGHQETLSQAALDARNGRQLLRRVLVAMRVAAENAAATSESKDVLMELQSGMEQLEHWGGWPTDAEMADYRSYNEDTHV